MGTDSGFQVTPSKYHVVADRLENNIKNGVYAEGDKLPSIRHLVKAMGVSKNTIISALQLLERKSLIESKPKSGFVVKHLTVFPPPPSPVFDVIQPTPISLPELLQNVLSNGAAFDIRPSETNNSEHHLINKLHRLINKHTRTQSIRKTQYYDDPMGHAPLREELSRHYSRLGVKLTGAEICTTAGCQHALFLALLATCTTGDNVVVESPGFYGVIQLLQELNLNVIEVPCNPISGLDVEVLAKVTSQYNVKACVVTPAFSTPTGACMPDDAKSALIELANTRNFAIIEDDIYGELGFRFRPKPIKYFDTDNRVVLCSSFSKSLSRDLRIGWIAGARWHKKIQRLKLISHLAGNQAIQGGLCEFMVDGSYTKYLRYRRNQLEQQRNDLLRTLSAVFKDELKSTLPIGGLSLWLALPKQHNSVSLYHAALAKNITLTPGALFSTKPNFNHYLRMSFCHPMTEGRVEAIKTINDLVTKKQRI